MCLVDPNKFWPGFTFPQPGFSNLIGVRFAQPLDTNTHIYRICFPWPARPNWLSSLSLVDPNKFWPGFTFPRPGFSNFTGFCFALNTKNTYKICFPWSARNWLSSFSLVDWNKFWPGFTFPWLGPSNFIGVRFTQPLNTNTHTGFIVLGLLDKTDSHCSALWTQTNFDLGSLSLSLSQILLAFVSLGLWTPTYI